jgi:hypothetical protein
VPTLTRAPVCGADNNTRYTDVFSTTYDITCGVEIVGDNLYAVHADTFIECIEYCDILSGCAATTYLDGAGLLDANCYPYSVFQRYNYNGNERVYGAVPINGPTNNTFSTTELCPQNDGQVVNDLFGNSYFIGCDKNIEGSDLRAYVARSLYACALYCSLYDTCVGVDFTGFPVAQNQANCYPKSSTGAVVVQVGTSYARRQ